MIEQTPSPDVLAEARRLAAARIEAMRAAPTLKEADDLHSEALVELCYARGRGELDLATHNQLARATIWAFWELENPDDRPN